MKSTADKVETLRRAVAEARLQGPASVIAALMAGTTPKGNALEVAKVAGIMAAKRCGELIPYCHPLSLDQVTIQFEAGETEVTVRAAVTAIARTGVEMEALTAASLAALTLYDMAKAMDASLVIRETRLVEKRGGKSDFADRPFSGMRAAVVVTSDGTASGERPDKSGRLIQDRLEALGLADVHYTVLPDDVSQITALLRRHVAEGVHLILTTGGTGLGPRDVTVEAVRAVIEREVPGIAEAMRGYGQCRTPYAMLSRGLAGQAGRSLIVTLPGSSRGVRESLDALFPAIFHAYPMMGGGGHS